MTSTDFSITANSAKRNATPRRFDVSPKVNSAAFMRGAVGHTMPAPWQTRGTRQVASHHQYGAPVRTFAEILFAPFRQIITNKPRKYALCAAMGLAVLILIF